MSLQAHRLCYALGAQVTGVDISQRLDDQTVADIRAALLEHCVLVFRAQPLSREQQIAFSRRFGDLEIVPEHRTRDRVPECPEILLVSNRPRPGATYKPYAGENWHSDRSNTCTPAMASLLHASEVPDVGGDTMFSNTYLAYETLSEGMKKLIGDLEGVHVGKGGLVDKTSANSLAHTKRLNCIAQPMVRVHPETGRKALFVGEDKVKQIVGMTMEESQPLLRFLCQHAARPQFIYRHRWQKDDTVMWDNRCTNHIAVNDYDKTQIRHLERTTVIGTPSGYVYEGALQ